MLEDVTLERMIIEAVGTGLGVALLPDQVEKLPHENVISRPLSQPIRTQSGITWKSENSSTALRANIVKERSESMR
ncbi:MAG: hypothetical protein H0X40_14800 [Chthoniobacterales bacterium]|nr:hypothetical protein [Chthoniobacterales bacterium]